MDTLPILPDDSAAEIERAREAIISTRDHKFPVLFENEPDIWDLVAEARSKKVRPPKVMPATLRVELRDYTCALFDASAATIIKHAENEALRTWLDAVAQEIKAEVSFVTEKRSKVHDAHCPIEERIATITIALQDRTEHWIGESNRWPQTARREETLRKFGQPFARQNLEHFVDAESRAQAQIHYERRLEQSRKPEERRTDPTESLHETSAIHDAPIDETPIDGDPIASDRQAMLSAFKSKAKAQGIKVTDAMIAKAAKSTWNERSMVTWWKRNDPQCKTPHDKLIRSVLQRDPSSIWPSEDFPRKSRKSRIY